MLEQVNPSDPLEDLDHVIENIHDLLSYESRDRAKIEKLLDLFDRSEEIKKRVKVENVKNQLSQKEVMEETLLNYEQERQKYEKIESRLSNQKKSNINFKESLISYLSDLFTSSYQMKQLESHLAIVQRRLQINYLLAALRQDLTTQFQSQQRKIDLAYLNDRDEQSILKMIQNEMKDTVGFKTKQKRRLESEIQISKTRQLEQQKEYHLVLANQNMEKIERIKMFKEADSYIILPKKGIDAPQGGIEQSKQIQQKKIEIKAISLDQSYKFEKYVALGLLVLTVLLLAVYCFS